MTAFMKLPRLFAALALLAAALPALPAWAIGQPAVASFTRPAPQAVALAEHGKAAVLFADPSDDPGVLRAAADLQADIRRVTTLTPALRLDRQIRGKDIVIIGTLGKSALIDQLAAKGVIDAKALRGKWEAFQLRTVANPLPGVERALVIAGSDRRGTIYGIYTLSEQIGVSPWYWWADVPTPRHDSVFAHAPDTVSDAPAVQYRGIFLNDEQPALTNWAKERFGGYNHAFYEKVFELILRLRGNYLWPAMWGSAFFDDDKRNGELAHRYGIVMGTSHHEPMMRAQQEWKRQGSGPWDYTRNSETLREFWRGGLRQTRDYDKVITIGMRGDGDEPMSADANTSLLERIVADQRKLIASEINPKVEQVPQLWALYKEVQQYYELGMRVPDDVMLLWCDDNWGNIRRLPTAAERARSGGAGVYYHFDYVGGPRSYKWINVTPIPKIWEQMNLAWEYDARRMWVVNVGDLKPMEVPIEFFLTQAWNPQAMTVERMDGYLREWAAREFGTEHAADIAAIVATYTQYNSRRKPEMLSPTTYSLVHDDEARRIARDYEALAARAEALYAKLPAAQRDAYFQLVLHPVKAGAVVNAMYVSAGLNALYARQGRSAANDMAARVRALFAEDAALSRRYNLDTSGGKWNHMMDQTHIGYTYWNQPPENVMPAVRELALPPQAALGVAVEGSAAAWPADGKLAALPALDAVSRKPRYIEVFNRGAAPLRYTVTASAPWITLDHPQGTVDREQRVLVNVLWDQAPADAAAATLTVRDADGAQVDVTVPLRRAGTTIAGVPSGTFLEADGMVAIEAEHYTGARAPAGRSWQRIPGHGRTLSGMATTPGVLPAAPQQPADMRLEYRMALNSAGPVTVRATLAPTLNFQPGAGLRYAVSFDDEPPQIVNLHAGKTEKDWERWVAEGAALHQSRHTIAQPGVHTLHFWALDPGIVLQSLVVDTGGLRDTYLGPQESPRAP
ncbi:glycosyl hydrolase [Duganella sp. FT92W]|uniref:Glycosyl hydrolase n=1 Tax=Pseudoduganella rivuli TaxID=2666085 RepID=A0A7X2IN97_9BURK|nr:glycosyl hydrolase 115 family protein [Pseudoduganella rivuli]MRV72697.1 glycosyl hydrolase [Pseudoduganella rivuli]